MSLDPGIINYAAPRRLLLTARGHPYEAQALAELCAGLDEFDVCLAQQPAAQQCMDEAAKRYDALLCYDMPGVDFSRGDGIAHPVEPEPGFKAAFLQQLDEGLGMVFLHHAIAAWPAWPEYAEVVGGRFHYRPASLRGSDWPDSGYRHGVCHRLSPACQHPVTRGLPAQWEMEDELYLCPVFEADVTPLLYSDSAFRSDNFYSAAHAVAGRMFSRDGWQHPDGSHLVAWAKRAGNSPVVYIQGGDDAAAMANQHYRTLVHNAVRWVASEEAHAWARRGEGV